MAVLSQLAVTICSPSGLWAADLTSPSCSYKLKRKQLQIRIENALDLMLSSEIGNERLKKKIEANEKRLVEIDDEIENLQLVLMPMVPDLEQFRKGLEEGLKGDFDVKRRTYTGLIDRIVSYDHEEISIEFNLQTIDHDPNDIDGRTARKMTEMEAEKTPPK